MFGFFKRRTSDHQFRYTCAECGQVHVGAPSFSFPHPPGYAYTQGPDSDADLIMDTEDWCVIGHAPDIVDYFIRVTLEIPINGTGEVFLWGVWVTQSKENFERYHNTFGQDQSGYGGFGWLFANFAPYHAPGQNAANLACDVHWQAKGTRPKVTLQDADHQLVFDQQNGIPVSRAIEIATALNHH